MQVNYAEIWKLLKSGKSLRIVCTATKAHGIRRMVSKHKDNDKAYKLQNPTRAKITVKVTPIIDTPNVELLLGLSQHYTNYSILLEDYDVDSKPSELNSSAEESK